MTCIYKYGATMVIVCYGVTPNSCADRGLYQSILYNTVLYMMYCQLKYIMLTE